MASIVSWANKRVTLALCCIRSMMLAFGLCFGGLNDQVHHLMQGLATSVKYTHLGTEERVAIMVIQLQ